MDSGGTLSDVFGYNPKYQVVSRYQNELYDHRNNFQRHCPGYLRLNEKGIGLGSQTEESALVAV